MPYVSNEYLDSLDPDKREKFYRLHTAIGYHPETGDTLYVPDNDRYAGTYTIGVQGVGKSQGMQNQIVSDIAKGNAVIVFDPHGDLITNCLATMAVARLLQTYLLDMQDESYPIGVNLFAPGKQETDVALTQAVERILHVFYVLWAEVMSQQHLPRYLRAITLTFLANPGCTLVDMYRFLTDGSFRYKLLQNVKDQTVKQFWQTQYEDLSSAEQTRRVQPLINRLESLFMGRSLVRNIVGQSVNSISFRKAIENREIIFIRLPIRMMEQDARLVGTLLLAQIHNAIFSFEDVPADKRPGVSLYVDEVQNFATPDFTQLFTEARKYGARITLAHQFRNQLPVYLQDSTMTARTKICFQTTPEDARQMAHFFPSGETSIRSEDIEPHPTHYLLTYPSDDWHTKVFTETYLQPIQSDKRGSRIEIETRHLAPHLTDIISGVERKNPRLADPTQWVDSLLYQVMKTGDPFLPIPPDAVRGFASCGVGFYRQSIGLTHNDPILLGSVRFPPALVVEKADAGLRWTRRPEGETEQLYHFIFHLRMVMQRLAEHPIGKATAASTSDVAKMLMSLPRRAAFVRSGETVGVIYTQDTPKLPSEREQAERTTFVRDQTRTKYCHPRAKVEAEAVVTATTTPIDASTGNADTTTAKQDDTPQSPLSRWEEV